MRELLTRDPDAWLAAAGLLIGLAFGAISFATNFCTMGAISDLVSFGDYRRFRSWVLAGAVAILGAQALAGAGIVALDASLYLAPRLNWLGSILGGLMFGFGMVPAGGCVSRNLARTGAGDLRALMTLITIGIVAYATMGGLLGPIRAALEQATTVTLAAPSQGLPELIANLTGWSAALARTASAIPIAGAMGLYCFADARFRSSRTHVLAGLGVGACVVAGWWVTGIAADDLAARPTAPQSLTFVRPTADTIEWVQRFTAERMPGFGVATVLGTILGALLAAKRAGRFKVQTFFDVADTKRSLLGAVLMGIGGVLALGCSVGQGITGLSTLALGSFLTFGAIVAGGVAGTHWLERSIAREA